MLKKRLKFELKWRLIQHKVHIISTHHLVIDKNKNLAKVKWREIQERNYEMKFKIQIKVKLNLCSVKVKVKKIKSNANNNWRDHKH